MDSNLLSWEQSDIERKLGFKGGKFTSVNYNFTFLIAVILTVALYGALYPLYEQEGRMGAFAEMFYDRGYTPYFITFFSAWSLAILFVKFLKVKFQRRTLKIQVVPMDHKFALTPKTVSTVIDCLPARIGTGRSHARSTLHIG